MGSQGKSSRLYEPDNDEEAKYLDKRWRVFEPKAKGLVKTLRT